MSATGRGAVRVEADFYGTPAFCVHRLLEALELPGGLWLEPSAGEGAIIHAVNVTRSDVKWAAFEIRESCRPTLLPLVQNTHVLTRDFLSMLPVVGDSRIDALAPHANVVIGNPPFSLAREFVERCLEWAPYVALLLRLNFLGSSKRRALFANEMPDIYVLPNRPSFTGHGTDATEYAWFVWPPERGRTSGRIEILAETPASERSVKNLDAVITTELNVRAVAIESESESECESRTSTAVEISNESESAQVANLPKEMAEEVGKARVAGGGNYIQHGDYVMMVDRWFYQKIQDKCIIQELIPAEALKKVVYEGTKKVEQDPNPVGSACSATVNFDGAGKLSAQSNSRAPVIALYGFNDGEIPDATLAMTLRQACKEDDTDPDLKGVPIQPARGMLIGLRTYPKEVQSRKGSYITGFNWYCIAKPGTGLNAPDLVKARLDAKVVGPEAFVKCVTEQLVTARAAGQVAVPTEELPGTAASAAAPTLPGTVPTLPAGGPPALPGSIVVVDPLAGWTLHPQNPAGTPDPFYYKGQDFKKKSELLAAAQK